VANCEVGERGREVIEGSLEVVGDGESFQRVREDLHG
jgi:hypothetical protein